MSSENFESLEEDFLALFKGLTSSINSTLPNLLGQARKNLARDIRRELDNAQCLLGDLDREVKFAPHPYKLQMNTRLKKYHHDFIALQRNFTQNENPRTTPPGLATRNELFSGMGTATANPSVAASNRSRLLQMNDTIGQTSETLTRINQYAAETDQVGVAIVDELGTQRESLIRTKERLVDTDSNLSKSRKILRSMYRRVMTNKLILVVIIILEIAILGGVVYYKFFRK